MTQVDLWPDTFSFEKLNAPVNLLREQAALLGRKTKNLVQADVKQDENGPGDFSYSFFLTAPPLNYQYKLFEIHHDVSLYPVIVLVESVILEEVSEEFERLRAQSFKRYKSFAKLAAYLTEPEGEHEDVRLKGLRVHSEEEFINLVREVLNSTKTVRIISALLAQVDPNWESFHFSQPSTISE